VSRVGGVYSDVSGGAQNFQAQAAIGSNRCNIALTGSPLISILHFFNPLHAVYVGGLAPGISEREVEDEFSRFGKVYKVAECLHGQNPGAPPLFAPYPMLYGHHAQISLHSSGSPGILLASPSLTTKITGTQKMLCGSWTVRID